MPSHATSQVLKLECSNQCVPLRESPDADSRSAGMYYLAKHQVLEAWDELVVASSLIELDGREANVGSGSTVYLYASRVAAGGVAGRLMVKLFD